MRDRFTIIETTFFAFTAIALWLVSAFSLHVDILNTIYPSGSWAMRGEVLRFMMIVYGSGFAAASIGSLLIRRNRGGTLIFHGVMWIRSGWKEAFFSFRALFASENLRRYATWLILIVTVGVAVRCFFLMQPMRYDEAYTFLNHVNNGVFGLFYYPVPNNHVLHTLLVRISVGIFGSSPVAIRLPAVVFGLLNIPLIFVVSRSLNNKPTAGFLVGSMVAVYPYLILYDTMARGYSLLIFLYLCLIAIGLSIVRNPSSRLSVMLGFLIALGLFDIPSFLFPAVGVMLWLTMVLLWKGYRIRWVITNVLIPCGIVAAAAAFVLYTPVIITSYGIDNIVGNNTVQGEPWHEFLNSLPGHILETANDFIRSIPFIVVVVLLLLLIGGLVRSVCERRWTTFLLFPSILIGAIIVFFAKHAIPFPRTWIYLLPLLFLFIDIGLTGIPLLSTTHLKRSTIIVSSLVAIVLMSNKTISSYTDTGYFPEAPILATVLSEKMTPQDRLTVKGSPSYPMYYYMWYLRMPQQNYTENEISEQKTFIVVKPSATSIAEMTTNNVREVISIGNAKLYVTCTQQDKAKKLLEEDILDEE